MTDPPPPEQLDAALPSLTVIRTIFQGGQRVVYEVEIDGESRVLKLMPEEGRARAEREVSIGKTFEHPSLSKVLDEELSEVEIDGVKYVFFTETLIDGEPLDTNDPLESCEALRMGKQLVEAVAYLWEHHHVVHRDIKPLNIIRRPDGQYVLLDIGVARHQDRSTLTVFAGEHQPGTIGYLAPEQLAPLKGRELDYRADLFAIGIVMFEQVKGHLPFDPVQPSYRTLLASGVTPQMEDLPKPLALVLTRLLASRPHGRFRLDQARSAFDEALEELECS